MSLTQELKFEVENHPVLKADWLLDKKIHLAKEDLCLWLSQEYFVSVEFVNWFLSILGYTGKYLQDMKELTNSNFYAALGALGPANEYLLKLEYGQMYESYQKLRREEKLPEALFFEVNLEADESHSAQLFRLIENVCDTPEKIAQVKEGNKKALDSRLLFYEGLNMVSPLKV